MKKAVFVLVGVFFGIMSSDAGAQSRYNYKTVKSGVYISVAGGYGFFESDDNKSATEKLETNGQNSPVVLAEIGYRFNQRFRTGLEYGFREITFEDKVFNNVGKLTDKNEDTYSTHTAMLNFYLDIPTRTFFVPYVGAGIGASFSDGKGDDDKTGLAAQGVVGASFELTSALSLFTDYRYRFIKSTRRQTYSDDLHTKVDFSSHNVIGGVRVNF